MLLDDVTVGHPGDVIADRAVQPDLFDPFPRLRADFPRVFEVITEQLFHHAHGALIGFVHDRVVVEILVKVMAELQVQLAPLRTVSHQRIGLETNVVRGPDAGIDDPFLGGPDDVAHLRWTGPTPAFAPLAAQFDAAVSDRASIPT